MAVVDCSNAHQRLPQCLAVSALYTVSIVYAVFTSSSPCEHASSQHSTANTLSHTPQILARKTQTAEAARRSSTAKADQARRGSVAGMASAGSGSGSAARRSSTIVVAGSSGGASPGGGRRGTYMTSPRPSLLLAQAGSPASRLSGAGAAALKLPAAAAAGAAAAGAAAASAAGALSPKLPASSSRVSPELGTAAASPSNNASNNSSNAVSPYSSLSDQKQQMNSSPEERDRLRTGSRARQQSSPTGRSTARVVPKEEGNEPQNVLKKGGSFRALKQSSYRVLPPSAELQLQAPNSSLAMVDIEAGEICESVRAAKRKT
jgi:hypothetical protein